MTAVSPLDWQTPIVDPRTGRPSSQFIRLWQLNFLNSDDTQEGLEGVKDDVEALQGEVAGLQSDVTEAQSDIAVIQTDLQGKADKSTTITAGTGLQGGGDLSTDRTLSLADTGVVAGTYGDSTHVSQITVDTTGRITSASEVAVSGGGGGGNWWFAPPTSTDFTILSGGAETITLTDDGDVGLIVALSGQQDGDYLHMALKTIPAPDADWEVTVRFPCWTTGINYNMVGVVARDSVGGRSVVTESFNGGNVRAASYAGLSGFNANIGAVQTQGASRQADWYRIKYVQATDEYEFYFSIEGKFWRKLGSQSALAYLANRADTVGLVMTTSTSSGIPGYGFCDHWTQSW